MFLIYLFIFLNAIIVGSFLNVVIYRVPRGQSVVTPRSRCPQCGTQICWYQNIPLLSYIYLRGKCSNCGFKIPIKYPLIELITGLMAVKLFPASFDSYALLEFVYFFSVACVLLVQFVIDIEHQLLPDKINLYFLLITVPYVLLTESINYWLIGGLIGFLGPLVVTWLFYKLRGQIGLGGGDIKLFGVLGLLLGPVGILHNIFMSCALGALFGLILILSKKMQKDTPLAFGPYIIITAVMQIYTPHLFDLINPFSFR